MTVFETHKKTIMLLCFKNDTFVTTSQNLTFEKLNMHCILNKCSRFAYTF